MTIGERIKQLLKERRVSARELSETLGVPPSTISAWLSGQEPKAAVLLKVAQFFGVTVEFLISGQHPEAALAKELLAGFERQFIQLHQGVYRVRIEKEVDIPAPRDPRSRAK